MLCGQARACFRHRINQFAANHDGISHQTDALCTAGVANTETIIAINSDPSAPIFKQCDYYTVGLAQDIIPQLVAALQENTNG